MARATIESDGLKIIQGSRQLHLQLDSNSGGSKVGLSGVIPFCSCSAVCGGNDIDLDESESLRSSVSNLIPYKNILWVDHPSNALIEDELEITYTKPVGNSGEIGVARLLVQVETRIGNDSSSSSSQ
ncbi:unnamed protein product [Ambrosiozyma monospora]|uniref:Unnamed protein product n=1 Tax=Ambrosiozyma monospora TaxID=43982 RepID=A0ACB5SWJ3_AMBMO|nr:unnamed protein product [Ambrosiozyma monospora]